MGGTLSNLRCCTCLCKITCDAGQMVENAQPMEEHVVTTNDMLSDVSRSPSRHRGRSKSQRSRRMRRATPIISTPPNTPTTLSVISTPKYKSVHSSSPTHLQVPAARHQSEPPYQQTTRIRQSTTAQWHKRRRSHLCVTSKETGECFSNALLPSVIGLLTPWPFCIRDRVIPLVEIRTIILMKRDNGDALYRLLPAYMFINTILRRLCYNVTL